MKQFTINLRSLLIGGILLSILSVVSCSTPRYATQMVERVSRDTIYVSNYQQDSIYIFKDRLVDRSRDTLYIKDKSIEYRYKLLRDTVRVVQRDSIPYEVTVTEVKEITRPLTWFDHLTRFSFWFLIGALVTYLFIKIKRVFKLI